MLEESNISNYMHLGGEMELSASQIQLARDRIQTILEFYLEKNVAFERANNIAQALALGNEDPTEVALDMLKHQGIKNLYKVVILVAQAWYDQIPTIRSTSPKADSNPEEKRIAKNRKYSEIRELDGPQKKESSSLKKSG